MALQTVALKVIHACSQTPAPANSLLAAVLEGGVVQAVCPPKSNLPAQSMMPSHLNPRTPYLATSPGGQISNTTGWTPQAQAARSPAAPSLAGVTRVSVCAAASAHPAPTSRVTQAATSSKSASTATRTEANDTDSLFRRALQLSPSKLRVWRIWLRAFFRCATENLSRSLFNLAIN